MANNYIDLPVVNGGGGSGVTSLNSLTGALTLATGTSGNDFNIAAASSTITLNIPSASATARGLISTGAQTIAGSKTFLTDVWVGKNPFTASNSSILLTLTGPGPNPALELYSGGNNAYAIFPQGDTGIWITNIGTGQSLAQIDNSSFAFINTSMTTYFQGDSTGITTIGNITTTGVGKGLVIPSGTNAKSGQSVLVAGSVVVSNISVTSSSLIFVTSNIDGGTPGWLRVSSMTPGTGFTITSSSGTDTSTVSWLIVESN